MQVTWPRARLSLLSLGALMVAVIITPAAAGAGSDLRSRDAETEDRVDLRCTAFVRRDRTMNRPEERCRVSASCSLVRADGGRKGGADLTKYWVPCGQAMTIGRKYAYCDCTPDAGEYWDAPTTTSPADGGIRSVVPAGVAPRETAWTVPWSLSRAAQESWHCKDFLENARAMRVCWAGVDSVRFREVRTDAGTDRVWCGTMSQAFAHLRVHPDGGTDWQTVAAEAPAHRYCAPAF